MVVERQQAIRAGGSWKRGSAEGLSLDGRDKGASVFPRLYVCCSYPPPPPYFASTGLERHRHGSASLPCLWIPSADPAARARRGGVARGRRSSAPPRRQEPSCPANPPPASRRAGRPAARPRFPPARAVEKKFGGSTRRLEINRGHKVASTDDGATTSPPRRRPAGRATPVCPLSPPNKGSNDDEQGGAKGGGRGRRAWRGRDLAGGGRDPSRGRCWRRLLVITGGRIEGPRRGIAVSIMLFDVPATTFYLSSASASVSGLRSRAARSTLNYSHMSPRLANHCSRLWTRASLLPLLAEGTAPSRRIRPFSEVATRHRRLKRRLDEGLSCPCLNLAWTRGRLQ